MKKLFSLLFALALALCLTACGGRGVTTLDATDYVQGLLDKTYLGQFSQSYLESVDVTEETANKTYLQGLEVEYAYFAAAFDFNTDLLSDEVKQQGLDLLADLYLRADYDVKSASAEGDGFLVEVAIRPIDLIPLVTETYMEAFTAEFAAEYANWDLGKVEALTPEEQETFWREYEARWASGVTTLFRDHLNELGYLEEQTVCVRFQSDENGVYSISEQDFANLDALILAYSR